MFFIDNNNLNKLSYGFALLFLVIGGFQQYLTVYFKQLGLEYLGYVALILVYVSIFITNLFVSHLIKIIGLKRSIVLASFLYLVSAFFMTLEIILLIYSSSILFGFAGALLWNAQNAYLIQSSDNISIGKNSGFFIMMFSLGNALGSILMGIMIKFFGYAFAFNILLLLGLLSTALLYTMNEISNIKGTSVIFKISSIFKSKTLSIVTFSGAFIVYFIYGLVISIIPIHIEMITMNTSMVGLLSGVIFIMPILLSTRIGALSDSTGRSKMIFIGHLFSLVGLFILSITSNIFTMLVALLLLSVSIAILLPMFSALQKDITMPESFSTITNLFVGYKYFGVIFGIGISYLFTIELVYIISFLIVFLIVIASYGTFTNFKELRNQIQVELRK
jgi:MFS family permease